MVMKWWGWGAQDKNPDISNMPKFLPFVTENVGSIDGETNQVIPFDDIQLTPAIVDEAFVERLSQHFDKEQLKDDKLTRILHSYGKSFRDLWRVRRGIIDRAPDLVVYPHSHEDVVVLVDIATSFDVCLIPFGGGTNIVGAFEASRDEKRMVISVDLALMNKVLHLDKRSNTAVIQAGMLGPDIEDALNKKNYSLGHFPDSFEFSTLGGWLATRSVGMQSDRFGTINDMTLSLRCATGHGDYQLPPYPHSSMGSDLNQLFLGSEGQLGIITEAEMKVHPVPEVETFGAVMFPSFSHGVNAIRECAVNNCLPNMMRLLDSEEMELSMHLKPASSVLKQTLESVFKSYLSSVKKFDLRQSSLLILTFAGSKERVKADKQRVLTICRRYSGVSLGSRPGKQWYARKYDYPYLRDLMMDYGFAVDVAETSVLWRDVLPLHKVVKEAGYQAMQANMPADLCKTLPRPGYMGCHLSHHYDNGTCLYFTFCFKPINPQNLDNYWAVKKGITDAIVAAGGSISHHHSIGYEHRPWLKPLLGEAGVRMLEGVKRSLDMKRQFGRANLHESRVREYE